MTPAKAQSTQSSENSENIFNFAPWRLGGINFLAVVLRHNAEVRK